MPRTDPAFRPNRRAVLAGAAATAMSPLLGHASTGGLMRERARRWAALLDEPQRSAGLFGFDAQRRRRWNYMTGSVRAPGLPLELMNAAQKDAARDLLAAGLSSFGLETAENIMLQQDILRDEWSKGSPDRSRERFSLSLFGEPSAMTPWAWRWEGHHLTITFTMRGDEIVSTTPKAFSSEPNTVPSGPHSGLVVLENETLGRRLFADLAPAAARAARLSERSFGNILAKPGRENAVAEKAGVPLGDMTAGQSDVAKRLIDLYLVDHLTPEAAEVQRGRLGAEDLAAVRFGWAGAVEGDGSIYYRLHGETFLIEVATLFNQPQHHHTIVLVIHRAILALDPSDRLVAVQTHDEQVALSARFTQVRDMAGMQDVEAAVGKRDPLALLSVCSQLRK